MNSQKSQGCICITVNSSTVSKRRLKKLWKLNTRQASIEVFMVCSLYILIDLEIVVGNSIYFNTTPPELNKFWIYRDMHQHLCGENYEGLCQKMTSIDGETLLKFLRNVSFQGNFILQTFDPMHQKCTLDRVDKKLNC